MEAFRINGHSSRRVSVRLMATNTSLLVQGEEESWNYDLNMLKFSSQLGSAPRIIYLPDGAILEVAHHEALERLLPHRANSDLIHRLEKTWAMAFAALGITITFVMAFYFWILPQAAYQAAMIVPASWNRQLGASAMAVLHRMEEGPTSVPPDRQHDIRRQFAALHPPTLQTVEWTLHFKNFGIIANAIALPSGDIVITDALVFKASSDYEIAAILAHELGHIALRHGLRTMLQSAGISAIVATLTGDFSDLATLSAGLLNLSYSRDMEQEADDYSMAMLHANKLPTTLLADALESLCDISASNTNATHAPITYPSILSTHPDIRERIARIRK